MISKLKLGYSYLNKRAIKAILFTLLVPIIALRLLGLLEPLEWTAYDLLFYFSPTEPKEERIVLVTWEERDIQKSLDMNLSDRTLVSLLKTIKAQKPRVIGLDLYRDIPYFSNNLEKQQNEQAYDELQEIFRSTPNLIGIEKVGKPTINPPIVLKEQGQVFASDIIIDADNIIRRAFIAKQRREKKDAPNSLKTIEYLGTKLAMEYLEKEEFSYRSANDGSLIFSKNHQKIVVNNLKTFDGGYINNDYHLDFLINWRRGNDLFRTISITDLLDGKIPPDFLKDKIVLIGNVAASTSDRHNTTLTRWNKSRWTHGLFILAQVTSSIVSAAQDERPLIKIVPWGSGYILLILSVASVAYVIYTYSKEFQTRKLYLVSSLFSLVLTILLSLSSLLVFQFGWWLPIIPAILGIWLTFITINNQVQIIKEKENVLKLELISKDLNHQLGNSLNLIKLNLSNYQDLFQDIYQILQGEYKEEQDIGAAETNTSFEQTQKGDALSKIDLEVDEIVAELEIIKKYKQRTTQLIKTISSSPKRNKRRKSNINELVKEIVKQVIKEKQRKFRYKVWIEEIYAPNVKSVPLERLSLEIILDNLIDNAFEAVDPQLNQNQNYHPTVKIETSQKKRGIEISVEDNGIGITKNRQQAIFDLFITFKINKGQGIGLYLVKEFVKLERGTIKVESQLGKGSKFLVFFPRKSQSC